MTTYLLMLLLGLLWGGGFVVSKLTVAAVAPEVVAFLRFFVAGMIMAGIMVWNCGREFRLRRSDLPLVLALGATGIAGYNLFFFWGVRLSLASDGAMIIPTLNPLITLFAAPVILNEQLTRQKLTGAAISLVGQVMIFSTLVQTAAADPDRLTGGLLYVGAAVCWSAYTILGRIAARRFTPMEATTWATLSGALMLLIPALFRADWDASGYTAAFWVQILYMSVGATVGGFFLWSLGVARLGASRTAAFLNLVPVSTLLLAYLALGEQPTWVQVLGTATVLSGVYAAGSSPAARQKGS